MPSAVPNMPTDGSFHGSFSSVSAPGEALDGEAELLATRIPPRRLSQSLSKNTSSQSLASKPSSGSMHHGAARSDRHVRTSSRRLRSQYPLDDPENHVEFILVATFDIDKGSIMEHQYPGPISGDETMLAELMLPDQAHNRTQDWTMFFLHKDNAHDSEDDTPSNPDFDANGDKADGSSNDDDQDAEDLLEGPPLIYVLNHVNTKHDETVKRGAVCRAMAICTRHPFVDVFKPVLVLAIEQYYRSPTFETLANLYESLNAMDLSLMPRLSLLEKMILQASTAKDMFFEKFEQMIDQQSEDAQRSNQALALRSGESTPQTGRARFGLPKDTHEFESYIQFNGHSIPVKVPTAKSLETIGNFSVVKLILAFSNQNTSKSHPFAIHPHMTTSGALTHPIIVLVNALLTQKRVVFLGHGRPSEEVAEAVLAACSLVSGGILRGFTRHAFPYTDLTKIEELQKVPGFIAGVTNPVFASNQQWWDLLCDLGGSMKISTSIEQPQITEGAQSFQQMSPPVNYTGSAHPGVQGQDGTGDAAFMSNVLKNIENRLGEGVIRRMWREWIFKFTRITAVYEEMVFGTSLFNSREHLDDTEFGVAGHGYVWADEASKMRELAGNVNRIEGWRATRSYYNYKQDVTTLFNTRPIKTLDLYHHHDRLRTQKLSEDESAAIFLAFNKAVHSYAEICQLLVTTSESNGGLFYISLGLLHPRREVRYKTVELLERIARHEAGAHYWNGLGRFQQLAFLRLRQEMKTASDDSDSDLTRSATRADSVVN